MKYIKVNWIHESKEDPVYLYSEIGDDMFEVRKVEVFPDGSYGYADKDNFTKDTQLGDQIFPSFEEINTQPEFKLVEISKEEFEQVWSRAHQTETGQKDKQKITKKRFWGLFG